MYVLRKSTNIQLALGLAKEIFPHDTIDINKGDFIWVLFHGSSPAGFCTLRKTGEYAFLTAAGICTEHRGKGLHKRLIKKRIAHAKRVGCTSICTYTHPYNTVSFENLQKMGFKFYLPVYPWAGNSFYYWTKEL